MGGSVTQTNTQIPITAKRNDLTSGTVREKLTEKLSKHQKLSLLYNESMATINFPYYSRYICNEARATTIFRMKSSPNCNSFPLNSSFNSTFNFLKYYFFHQISGRIVLKTIRAQHLKFIV